MKCAFVKEHLDAFVDGELEAATHVEFDRHMIDCPDCKDLSDFAMDAKKQVRSVCREIQAPVGLRASIVAALDAEDADGGLSTQNDHARERGKLVRFVQMPKRYAIPAAAAAALALAYVGTTELESRGTGGVATTGGASSRAGVLLPALEDVVRVHHEKLPSDVRESDPKPDRIATYFHDKVGFPVRSVLDAPDAHLVGARLSNVRERRAAALYYKVRNNRVTVVVFESPEDLPLKRVSLGGRSVYYQRVRGYDVPVVHQNGLSYAFLGDMDRNALFQLAVAAKVR